MPNYLTTQKGKFFFDGKSSHDFGIIISKVPSLSRPQRKFELYQVPGRSGAVIQQLDAWEDIQISYRVWFANEYFKIADAQKQAREIVAWLYSAKGYCRLEDDFEPEYFRLAYFTGPMDIETDLCRYGEATITFTCRPERFLKSGEDWLSLTPNSANTVINPTAFIAKPLIKVTVSTAGTCNATVGTGLFTLNVSDYLYVDSETQDVYRQSAENRNNKFSGTMPTFPSGSNTVNITNGTGVVSKIEVQPRWWTL